MRYVGMDLTSAFSDHRARPIDVAIVNDALEVTFGLAHWPAGTEVAARSVPAIRAMLEKVIPAPHDDVIWAIDGPQGLSEGGSPMRLCERRLGTSGKTPDTLPPSNSKKPFLGYIRSSLDLFDVLAESVFKLKLAGLDSIDAGNATLFEIFPGAEWSVLAGSRLSKKGTAAGRQQRRQLFEALGVKGLPAQTTADQSDALVGAYLAWCSRLRPERVTLVGKAPARDPSGRLVEGFILHATSSARVLGWEPKPAVADEPRALAKEEELDAWAGDSLYLKFTDAGLIHGQESENSWLVPQTNYRIEVQDPYPRVHATLTWSRDFSGGRAWTISPTVTVLLRALGSNIDLPSRQNPLTVPVEIA